jgi:hypothetical protein
MFTAKLQERRAIQTPHVLAARASGDDNANAVTQREIGVLDITQMSRLPAREIHGLCVRDADVSLLTAVSNVPFDLPQDSSDRKAMNGNAVHKNRLP